MGRVEKNSDGYWRAEKTKELSNLISACAGLWFESYVTEQTVALHDSIEVRSQVLDRYSNKVKVSVIDGLHFDNGGKVIPANEVQTYNSKVYADKITQPYLLEKMHSVGSYVINDERLVGNPENPDLPKVSN